MQANQTEANGSARPSTRITGFIVMTIIVAASVGRWACADEPSGPTQRWAGEWDTHSDTWVATDALGRMLPSSHEVGLPRDNKTVGIFYFLWLGRHGEQGPFDISKILRADPTAMDNRLSSQWGPLGAPHHWGEPLFGYYVSDDDCVLRKHAQMLVDAGVDMVVFDVTNQFTYPESWRALCRVWEQMRQEGNRVPQIAFLTPFGTPHKVVFELWSQLYQPGQYEALWFRWEGKPLILADPDRLHFGTTYQTHDVPAELQPGIRQGQSFTTVSPFVSVGGQFPTWATSDAVVTLALREQNSAGRLIHSQEFASVGDNAWLMLNLKAELPAGNYVLEAECRAGKVGWWSSNRDIVPSGQAFADGAAVEGDRSLRIVASDDEAYKIRDFFTFRKPQPSYFTGPTGPEQWGWLEVAPQHAFYKVPGIPEQITVGVAQNAVEGKLSALSNPRSHGRSFHDSHQPPPENCDTTGRNFSEQWERALQVDPPFVFVTGWNEWIAGRFDHSAPFFGAGPVTFVDQFDQEFSRDCEPMKGGHADNYYYQLASHIRRYKGVRPLRPVSSQSISIDGDFEDWRHVQPEFCDTIGDPVRRDHRGWGKNSHYVNDTGRNDIVVAKVGFDDEHIYLYVRTQQPLSDAQGTRWMQLLIDSDRSTETGWLGYDLLIHKPLVGEHRALLEHNQGGFTWGSAIEIDMRIGQREIELAVPRSLLKDDRLDFKWSDNSLQEGLWTDFTLHGDAAPNDRFNYRAQW